MTMTDPIADMLTRIRNASGVRHLTLDVPYSKEKWEMLRVMKSKGFILGYDRVEDNRQGVIKIALRYTKAGDEIFSGIERVSKPSFRIWAGAKDIAPVKGGAGIAIVSTSRGFKTDAECREENVGGEVLCRIW